MNRRKFFKNLIGATAAAAIAPDILAQIAEYEYEVEGKQRPEATPPEQIFAGGEGLWVFQDDKLVAWSSLHGVSISWERDLDIATLDSVGGWREYTIGQSHTTFDVENLHINNFDAFENQRTVQLITKMKNGSTMTTEGVWIDIATSAIMNEPITNTCTFHATGEIIMTYD